MGGGTAFQPGNNAGLTHGLRAVAAHLPEDQTALADTLDSYLASYVEQSLSDAGGPSEIGVRARSQHFNRAIIQRSIHLLAAALETKGLFDRRGKLRVAWLQRLEGLVNSARQIDVVLGLERRPRRITPSEALMEAEDE